MSVKINPLPGELPAQEMDRLLNGELSNFEKWAIERQRAKGYEGAGLITAERGIIKAYLVYAATARGEGEVVG